MYQAAQWQALDLTGHQKVVVTRSIEAVEIHGAVLTICQLRPDYPSLQRLLALQQVRPSDLGAQVMRFEHPGTVTHIAQAPSLCRGRMFRG